MCVVRLFCTVTVFLFGLLFSWQLVPADANPHLIRFAAIGALADEGGEDSGGNGDEPFVRFVRPDELTDRAIPDRLLRDQEQGTRVIVSGFPEDRAGTLLRLARLRGEPGRTFRGLLDDLSNVRDLKKRRTAVARVLKKVDEKIRRARQRIARIPPGLPTDPFIGLDVQEELDADWEEIYNFMAIRAFLRIWRDRPDWGAPSLPPIVLP